MIQTLRAPLALCAIIAATAVMTAIPPARLAGAAMAVVDATAITKLTAQLNQLKRQYDEVVEVNKNLQREINAIGEAGRLVLPVANMTRIGFQLRSAKSCLIPDLTRMLPSVDFDDVDLGDLCRRSNFYRDTMFATREAFEQEGVSASTVRSRALERRRTVLADAVMGARAQSDQSHEDLESLALAADDLARTAGNAQTMNDRLAVIAQGQAVNARGLAVMVQILSQMQRQDAAYYLATATSIEDAPPPAEDDEQSLAEQ